jgi:TPR repeat protein
MLREPNGRKPAFDMFAKACTANVAPACHEVALAWDTGREPIKALPFYQKACTGGVTAACDKAKRLAP